MKLYTRVFPFILAAIVAVFVGVLLAGSVDDRTLEQQKIRDLEQQKLEFAQSQDERDLGAATRKTDSEERQKLEDNEYLGYLERLNRGESLTEREKERFLELEERYGTPRCDPDPLDNQGGPDAFGYMFVDNQTGDTATYEWIELRGDPEAVWINTWTSHDDGYSTTKHPFGLTFPFYGLTYDSFRVMVNGNIQFTTTAGTLSNACLPASAVGGPAVFLFWNDLHLDRGGIPSGTDVVGYKNFGDYVVLEYDSIGAYSAACTTATGDRSFKFEALLFADGRIKMQYNILNIGGAASCDSTMTIGVQSNGVAGSPALHYVCNTTGIQAVEELAIWFYPSGTGSISGTVEDDSGDPVGNARVRITENGLTAYSDASGSYSFPMVTMGTYELTASKHGYQSDVEAGVVVSEGENTAVDFTLVSMGYETYTALDVPLPIPTPGVITSIINVPDVGAISDLDVLVNITHTYDGDLRLSLTSPDNITVMLCNRRGAAGDNFNNTIFDDEGDTLIANGHVPFAGIYVPESPLGAFDGGTNMNGNWTLTIEDLVTGNSGTLNAWELYIAPGATSGGVITGTVTSLDSGDPIGNAVVEIDELGTTRTSDGAGVYAFSFVGEGTYTLNFGANHYDPLTVPNVVVTNGQTTTVNAELPGDAPTYSHDFEADNGLWVATPETGGWEWGTPTAPDGPPAAHSGTNVWGTVLAGDYPNSACWTLDLNLGLVVESATATVEGWLWYSTETNYDGLQFHVSTDGGNTWELVTPEGGYPQDDFSTNACLGTTTDYWGGNSNGWIPFVLPIGNYQGQAPILRFWFGSDPSVVYPGMFLDDITIWGLLASEDGPPNPVTNFQAQADDHTVTLTWLDPAEDIFGNAIVVDSIQVWLGMPDDGVHLGTVGSGVQTFVHADAPSGNLTYSVRPYNNGGSGSPSSVTLIVGNPSYVQDFEANSGFWVADPDVGGWEWGSPTAPDGPPEAHSGTNLWGTVLAGDYAVDACYMLTLSLGMVVESPTATVEFWRWFDTENNYDGCNFKVSIDQGATWTVVEPEGGYGGSTNGVNFCNPNELAWSGHNGDTWAYTVIPIGQFIGQVPDFRFTLGADDIIHYPGFYFDDMIIWGLQTPDHPVGVVANGNFDDRIRISWLPLDDQPQTIDVGYDNGWNSANVDGIGWWSSQPESGWFVAHYRHNGPVDVLKVRAYFTNAAVSGTPIQVGIFADAGNGLPASTPLEVVNAVQQEPFEEYQTFELSSPLTIADGSFFVGVRQLTANNIALGGDESVPFVRNTFFSSSTNEEWTSFEPAMMMIPMLGACVSGDVNELWLEPAATHRDVNSKPHVGPVAKSATKSDSKSGAMHMSAAADLFAKEAPVAAPSYKQSLTTADAWRMTGRSFFAVEPHAPQVALALPDQHRGGSPLDEVVYYKIYRNNVWLANDAETPYDDVVGSALENVTYNYFLTAIYDDSSESTHSDTVQAAANMAPGAPTNVTAEPLGSSQMHITWTDPTLNADGTTCTDLATLAIYRNGTLLGTVNPGVQQYTDTPPEPTQFYTWTITGRDEIPNEGPGGSATGAVQSPWIQIPYEWIDIADVGTAVTNCDDCNEGPFPLGFTMPYWGNNYSDIRICSNGFASFTSTSNSLGNVAIPSAAQPNDALFGFWDDLDPAETGGQVLYYADAAEQRFVISWLNVQHYPSGNPITFQFVLTPDGGVVMNWQIVALTNLSTHGVENVDGTDGLQLSHLGVGDFIPTDGSAIQFWGERIPQGFLDGIVRQLSNNSPLADVLVTATNPTNTEAALTDATGHYILELDSGAYTVTFSKDGFCDSVRTNILIEEDQTTVLNVSLRNPVAQLSVTSIQHESGPGQLTSTTFDITNPGNCALDFTITDDQPWLSTDPATGSVAAGGTSEITVWFDANGMGIGEYEGELTLTHSATGSPITVPVDLFIADAAGNHEALPTEFALNGNYPNPFNAVTEIRYDVPQASFVTIMLYNVLGQEVRTLVNTTMDAGRHVALWDGRDERGVDMTSGLYLMRMVAADHVFTGKLMMLK